MDGFVHLEVQSAFSFLWGAFTPEALIERVSALGQRAAALTDYGFHGLVGFYKAALAAGIRPIVGAKVLLWDGTFITFLAKNFKGYGNLCRLVSISLDDSMAPVRPLTRQDVAHWSGELVCLAGGWGSRVEHHLRTTGDESARLSLLELRDVLREPHHLFLTVENHCPWDSPKTHDIRGNFLERVAQLGATLGIPLVASNKVTFLHREEYILHRTLVSIQRRHHHRRIAPLPNDSFFLASGSEMAERIPYPEAIANTFRVAALCAAFSLPVGKLHPPSFQDSRQASKKLAILCFKKIAARGRPAGSSYVRRLGQELEVINRRGLSDFFLLVRRITEFAEERRIRHSVRGSAAASLVVHLLLGGVDPLAHNLLFERFINDGRSDLPDIDIDFDSERRDEVMERVMDLLPRRAAMTATIHKLRVRSAVRLTARALGYDLQDITRLSNCLPWSLRGRDLNAALDTLPELRNAPLKKEDTLVRLAARLTGLPFQCSVHLGGVIIAPGDMRDWTPVGRSPKGLPLTQLDKDDTGALGLLKLDLLGLRMHTAIRKSLDVLEQQGIKLNLPQIPLDDPDTYALLQSTESVGVFQLESPGQRNLLGLLRPNRFSDLIAEISLFRPGPVEGDMVRTYVKRRHREIPVEIPHKDVEPILNETYGVILFQEQALRIVHVFAGLSYAEADVFRRAMTKDRGPGKMQDLKERFVQGAMSLGRSKSLAEHVFSQVAAFASYGFCKAHAASFAHITYQSAFLKAHYPRAFYIGLLNAGQVGSYPAYVVVNEARRRGISMHPPHVNCGGLEYEPDGSAIRAPLTVVEGVGASAAARILSERGRRGLFLSLSQFASRMGFPRRIMQALDRAGAFDGLDGPACEFIQGKPGRSDRETLTQSGKH